MTKFLAALGLNPEKLLDQNGPFGKFALFALFLIIFAESGLLIGFFLPGDSLLFVAGLLSAGGKLAPLPVLLIGCFLAAFLGDQVGYAFGKRVGPSLFRRPDSRIFKQMYVEKAKIFFEKHGAKTIILARFVPVVRTFAPILAGVGEMKYRVFMVFNVVGALLWAVGFTLLGYLLGNRVPFIKNNIEIAAIVIVVLSIIPAAIEIIRHRREQRAVESEEAAEAEAAELHEAIGD
ncbi:MAG: VTT domain-containing protein [Acidimicrobiia bacterium]